MSSLIKVASLEKKAGAAAAKAFAQTLGRGATKATKFFDKNIYRPVFNLTRPGAARVSRSNWAAYRRQNPAVMYRLGALGGLGYGGMKLYEGAKQLPPSDFSGLKEFFQPVGDAAKKVWDNKGTVGGASLPILAFLATRGRSGAPRNLMPTVAASGALGYGGRQLDNWNRKDIAETSRQNLNLQNKVLNAVKFHERNGVSRNSLDGGFRPNNTMDYVDKPLGLFLN
jgi:hypothetical protein